MSALAALIGGIVLLSGAYFGNQENERVQSELVESKAKTELAEKANDRLKAELKANTELSKKRLKCYARCYRHCSRCKSLK